MKVGPHIVRVVIALWLCIGPQMHIAVDHADLFHHGTQDHLAGDALPEQHGHLDPAVELTGSTICCIHTPQHQHHDSNAPHSHWTDALLTGSAQRGLSFLHAAVLPAHIVESLPDAAPAYPATSVALASEAPAAHNAALRAPPLA